jgi:ATP-dependent helicase/nuclease subunit A
MSAVPSGHLFAFPRNLVLAASAGTGKTHSLVGVVVHALLGASEIGENGLHAPVDPARIVATTFSRKAAAEIRARIAEGLEALASGLPSKYRDSLDLVTRAHTGKALADATVRMRARAALDGLPNAQIGTLHGFASKLVRAHALELGISPGFAMADEAESKARLELAISRVFERRSRAGDVEIRRLAEAAGGVDRLLGEVALALVRLEEDGRGAGSIQPVAGDAQACVDRFERLVGHARELATDAKLGGTASDLLAALVRGAPDSDERFAALIAAASAFTGERKTKNPAHEAFFAFRDGLKAKTNPLIGEQIVVAFQHRHAFAERAAAACALLVECETELRELARSEAILGFGDVLRLARDALRDHPRAAAEVGARYDLLLVDELQDTSRIQRELVQLVWEDGAGQRAAGQVPPVDRVRRHGLLVVGDRKQSIYAFRGADVGVFAELCVALAGETARRALGIAPGQVRLPATPLADFVPLRHNRRGTPPLLAFANAFSAARFAPQGDPPALFEIAYNAATEDLQVPAEAAEEAASARPPGTTWLRLPEGRSSKLDQGRVIAARIAALMGEGGGNHGGSGSGGKVTFRDVAVLARTNGALEATAHALAERGLPYVVAGRGFYTAREVRDLAAMLALLLDPSDRHAMAQVLRGPWTGAHDATLLGLTDEGRGLARVGSAWDHGARRRLVQPADVTALAALRRVVEALSPELDRLGPGIALRAAVRQLGLEETWIQLSRGAQRVANGRKLLAMADLAPSARAFLDRLDDAALREDKEVEAATFSEDEDAVRLLTIHASKGLDFPVVFLPELDSQPTRKGGTAFFLSLGSGEVPSRLAARHADDQGTVHDSPSLDDLRSEAFRRELAEQQRLAYVAVTRVSRRMYLVGPPPKRALGSLMAVSRLLEDPARAAQAALEVEEVVVEQAAPLQGDLLAGARANDSDRPAGATMRAVPAWRRLPIAPTALQDFARCRRRFQLVHVLHLPEPDLPPFARTAPPVATEGALPRLDARAEGTLAHRLLERIDPVFFGVAGAELAAARVQLGKLLEAEGVAADHPRHAEVVNRVARLLGGAYAREVAAAGGALAREEPFVLHVQAGSGSDAEDAADTSRHVVLRGTIDLVVVWPSGDVDVLDYKSARGPDAAPYAFQLDVYAHAARARFARHGTGALGGRLRTGILFLGGDAGSPGWRDPSAPADVERRLARLGTDLVEARWRDEFPPASRAVCDELHCGFRLACWRGGS